MCSFFFFFEMHHIEQKLVVIKHFSNLTHFVLKLCHEFLSINIILYKIKYKLATGVFLRLRLQADETGLNGFKKTGSF